MLDDIPIERIAEFENMLYQKLNADGEVLQILGRERALSDDTAAKMDTIIDETCALLLSS